MSSLVKRAFNKLKRIGLQKTKALRFPQRVAIVGFGGIAPDHLQAYEDNGIASVVAVSDLNANALAEALDQWPFLRTYRDYRQMLEEIKPDIVDVCTWPQHHAEAVCTAAAMGVRGILCEKPLALQLGEMERMLAACVEHGVKLACGHQYRFHPLYVQAAELIRGGELGQIEMVRGNIKSTLANNGPHLVDTVRFLLGDRPATQVKCSCRRERGEVNRSLPAEDEATGEILFEGGIRFELETGDLSQSFFGIKVQGASGSLEVTPTSLVINGKRQDPGASSASRKQQFREFVQWVKGKRPDYAANGESGTRTAELVLALYESARLGQPVAVPLANKGDVIRQLYPASGPAIPQPAATQPATVMPGRERLAQDGGPRAVKNWFPGTPAIGAAELAGLTRVVLSKQLNCVDGHVVKTLEQEFAALYGSRHAVASTSGTSALHVALGTLNPDPCSEVITTPLTDMGSVIPILACNCVPVFADIDPETGNMTAESIAEKTTPRTRAVILVHLFGRAAAVGPIRDMLAAKNIALIEDCSQAHLAEYHGKKVGTFGDFGCFSLQQSKQITCGDGGLTLINRDDLADRAAMYVDKGWDRKGGKRSHLFFGMNYRMTELQAAVALAQLRKLPRLVEARRAGARLLNELLRQTPGVQLPPQEERSEPSWWIYTVGIDEQRLGISTDAFWQALRVEGVRAKRSYLPQPLFDYEVIKDRQTYGSSGYPLTDVGYAQPSVADYPGFQEFCQRWLCLSWSHHVRAHHVHAIAAAVKKVITLLPKTEARSAGHTQPQISEAAHA